MDIEADSPTTVHVQGRPRTRSPEVVHGLAVVAGPASGLRRLLDEETIRIGKAADNHLRLADPAVSRYHCAIERTARGLMLRDLRSSNGSRVGGCWVESAYLVPDVPIQIGSSVLQLFVATVDNAQPAPPAVAPRVLGSSPAIHRIVSLLPRLAHAGTTLLIEGETGTGKSMIAELVHRMGPRADGRFVVVDCGTLPPSLIDSELFGHERGAFTGASERRIGMFEAAEGGTLFLDEIGELPLEVQPRLLRALEERTIRRVGSVKPVHLDLQIVAATNRDLSGAVARGQFRADLYYRLDSVRLTIPPLRERREDIPALVEHFCRRTRPAVGADLVERMKVEFAGRPWPGNVRELRNAVERAVLFEDLTGEVTAVVSPAPPGEPPRPVAFDIPFSASKGLAIESWERTYLTALMSQAAGNLSKAARMAQIDRTHLRELLRRHRIGLGGGA
jgi:transcriptional regulator with GAF, ATPase, and Fis domain